MEFKGNWWWYRWSNYSYLKEIDDDLDILTIQVLKEIDDDWSYWSNFSGLWGDHW